MSHAGAFRTDPVPASYGRHSALPEQERIHVAPPVGMKVVLDHVIRENAPRETAERIDALLTRGAAA